MTSILRPSTRQLARFARLGVRATSRPPYGVVRGSQLIGAARAVQFYRFYSSEPPREPKKDDSDKDSHERKVERRSEEDSNNNKEPESQKPEQEEEAYLRPGWVRLNEDELKELERIASKVPQSQKENADIILRDVKKIGAPPELRDLLQKNKSEGLSIADFMKVMRLAWRMADELARYEVERDAKKGNKTTFDSKAPGHEESRDKSQEQKQEKQEQPGKAQEDGQKGGKGDQPKRPQPISFDTNDWVTTAIAAAVLYSLYKMLYPGENSREITWQELRKNFLDKGLVEKLVVIKDRVRVDLNREATQSLYPDSVAASPWFHYYFTIGSIDAFERRLEEAQNELGIPSSERIPVSYATESALSNLLLAFGPTLLFFGLIYWFSRRSSGGGIGGNSGLFGYTKSKAKMFNHETAVKVKFADVAGADEAKVEIMEFVSFLKQPERFQRLGAKIPRGAILSGPPGTGKTLLAKATAGESGVPFFSVSGSEFIEVFVGVGASRVRDLFATARRNAPCIIFIDEIDAVGKSRAGNLRMGNDERESTLNQILTEMDGFNTSEQVVVLAGTNRPDTLDAALMRPGRFDRHIHIDRPTAKGRQDIFRVHLQKILTNENMEFLTGRLAALTPGFAGADIANAVNEAALIAARANAQSVEMIHFEQAIERVVGGLERKSLVLSPEEKRTVAYHEAGHAICGWFFEHADPLLKVSIIPRGQGALGYAQYVPVGDAYLMSTKQLMDRMAMTLGGRVSEELHFPTVTTGASDDFKKVTRMASNMVTQWGMSEKLGPLHFQNDPQNQVQKPFAESTAQTIDAEVRRIIDEAYKQCKDLLTAKKKEIGLIAEELLRKEMLDRDDMIRLLGPRPFADREEFTKFFDGTRGKGLGKSEPPPPPPAESIDPPPTGPQPALFESQQDVR